MNGTQQSLGSWAPYMGFDNITTESHSNSGAISKAPMLTLRETATALCIYYTVVFGGARLMEDRPPFDLKEMVKYWNLGLSTLSLVLLICYVQELVPTLWQQGVTYAVCNRRGGWSDGLEWLYYVCRPVRLDVMGLADSNGRSIT